MRKIHVALLLMVLPLAGKAQEFGLSFSYFVPRNGEFSTPVSPFSIRGIGADLNRYLSVQTGASLYRMAGLNMTGLPFNSQKPLAGPSLTLMVPAELVLQFGNKSASFSMKGGGFAYSSFFQRLNAGNFDRALRTYENWTLANSDLSGKSKPGFGWMAGVEFRMDVTRQWGLSFEVNYLAGKSPLAVSGTYSGVDSGGVLQNRTADFKDAKLDLTGLEFSLGILMSGR